MTQFEEELEHLDHVALGRYLRVRFDRLERIMSDLAGEQAVEAQAITDLGARIDTITGPLQSALDAANAAASAALAADATDKAAADAARAQIDAAFAEAQRQVDALNALAQPPAPPAP